MKKDRPRCEAAKRISPKVVQQCAGYGKVKRDGRKVCVIHSRVEKILWWNDDPA